PFDFHGQKELGRGDFRKIPNGLPGVEDRLDLIHDGGVVSGRITRERWVEICSTAPARLFGMYPRKGSVSVGADADLVVYDPRRKHTLSAKTHHMNVDYSCYEGRSVQGGSDVVLSRGGVVVRDGDFTGRKGHGRFVKRDAAEFVRRN
ncbi:MAG TPA: amidohydrolase family protein, partial [Candidatus Limnocylindrales bacterium]|nr:amidohydrolase family protein [Candidatus Limnocylindrales bacterium]